MPAISTAGTSCRNSLRSHACGNAAALTAIFQETVDLTLRLGLTRLGHGARDGTKAAATASKHQAMSY
jgi:hypothetical protein